nr:hypothetical protein [Candidatus Sigynarchaeota archaeon]
MVLFQFTKDSFTAEHEDLVVGFLKAIDSWASEFSGKGADVFQTETIRITFEKSMEFNMTFASCTDLTEPIGKDRERLETIKYAFIHNFWELFTSERRKTLQKNDKDKFIELLKALE